MNLKAIGITGLIILALIGLYWLMKTYVFLPKLLFVILLLMLVFAIYKLVKETMKYYGIKE